jgi:hypothetical protein
VERRERLVPRVEDRELDAIETAHESPFVSVLSTGMLLPFVMAGEGLRSSHVPFRSVASTNETPGPGTPISTNPGFISQYTILVAESDRDHAEERLRELPFPLRASPARLVLTRSQRAARREERTDERAVRWILVAGFVAILAFVVLDARTWPDGDEAAFEQARMGGVLVFAGLLCAVAWICRFFSRSKARGGPNSGHVGPRPGSPDFVG